MGNDFLLLHCSKEDLDRIPALANNPIKKQIIDAFFDKRWVESKYTKLCLYTHWLLALLTDIISSIIVLFQIYSKHFDVLKNKSFNTHNYQKVSLSKQHYLPTYFLGKYYRCNMEELEF